MKKKPRRDWQIILAIVLALAVAFVSGGLLGFKLISPCFVVVPSNSGT